MAKLTPKQKLFIDEYLVDLNATQAAIRAGYSKKTAFSIGIENLKKPLIQSEIQKRQEKIKSKLEITQEKVIQELAAVGFANGTDFARIKLNKLGFAEVELVPTDKLPDIKKAAVAGIKETQTGIEVKTYDKVKALELLGKYLGLFDDKSKIEEIEDTEDIDGEIYG